MKKSPITGVMVLLAAAALAGCGVGPPLRGASPTPTHRIGPITPLSLYMVSSADGWALTARAVYRTQDGGRDWTNVTPVGYRGLGNGIAPVSARGTYAGAAFPTAQTAVIRPTDGRDLWFSQDGGRIWHHVRAPGPPQSLTMLNAFDGWIEVPGGAAAGSEAVRIYRTTDGGQAWTLVSQVYGGQKGPAGHLPFVGAKLGLAFGSTANGVAVGEGAAPGTAWVYHTHNGGTTWHLSTVPMPVRFRADTVVAQMPQFFGPRRAVVAVTVEPVTGGAHATIVYHTSDGGAHWVPGHVLAGAARVVDFVSPTTGWALTQRLYRTTNGGRTWVPTGSTPKGLGSLDFVSASHGWWSASPAEDGSQSQVALQRTQDGAQTWRPWDPEVVSPGSAAVNGIDSYG